MLTWCSALYRMRQSGSWVLCLCKRDPVVLNRRQSWGALITAPGGWRLDWGCLWHGPCIWVGLGVKVLWSPVLLLFIIYFEFYIQ
jgi:hypothetical protein